MGQHPVELGEEGAQPHRPDRHLHPEHRLDAEDDAELVGERREPVVPVREDRDLPVVPDLEQLLRAPVHVADDRLGARDPLTVEDDAQPQHPVGGRVLRPDVEDHVGGREPARADADVEVPWGALGAHRASLPHAAAAGAQQPAKVSPPVA